jgi:hypothetical protein
LLRLDSHQDGDRFGFDFFSGGVFWADERDRDFAFSSIGKAVDERQARRYGTRRRILDENEANRRDKQRCFYAAASPFASEQKNVENFVHASEQPLPFGRHLMNRKFMTVSD